MTDNNTTNPIPENSPTAPKKKSVRKWENRVIAAGVAAMFAYTAREMTLQNDASTAVFSTVIAMGLIWYAFGGLRTS
ncbi:hypothetical protein [Epibacterium ulvae]|uniref:hypothetical protein n=1 Tax=Epibacterium ulvae TaxID=1156985 RepID=UPI0024908867|nr:hypothetical protein [Epibacterium ulvae]